MNNQDQHSTYTYGAGTRLSEAYTKGRDGLPCPVFSVDKTSQSYKAWKRGHDEYEQEQKEKGVNVDRH